mgnify:CR=1 FL=1
MKILKETKYFIYCLINGKKTIILKNKRKTNPKGNDNEKRNPKNS